MHSLKRYSGPGSRPRPRRGYLLVEAAVAMGILALVLVPFAMMAYQESRAARAYYYRAVAMEIVDGEIEALEAGQWQAFQPGVQPYPVTAPAATNLPPGRFTLTLTPKRIRLEWRPRTARSGPWVVREVKRP